MNWSLISAHSSVALTLGLWTGNAATLPVSPQWEAYPCGTWSRDSLEWNGGARRPSRPTSDLWVSNHPERHSVGPGRAQP